MEEQEIFTLEVSDHGRSIDSSWSSLALAQAEAVRITQESDVASGLSRILPGKRVALNWEQEQHGNGSTWHAVTHEGVSGTFGFSITRTVLDARNEL